MIEISVLIFAAPVYTYLHFRNVFFFEARISDFPTQSMLYVYSDVYTVLIHTVHFGFLHLCYQLDVISFSFVFIVEVTRGFCPILGEVV